MMKQMNTTILFGALAVFMPCCLFTSSSNVVSAFSFSELVSKQTARASAKRQNSNALDRVTITTLGLTTTTRSTNGVVEEDAAYIYNQARDFAFKDNFGISSAISSSSDDSNSIVNEYDQHYHPLSDEKAEIEEAKFWLREIIQVQSGCVAGTLAGKDLCENQDQAAEIVARLRRKIEVHEQRVAVRTKGSESIVPTIATELIVGALLVVVVMFWTTLDVSEQHDDIPAMANYQEWMSVLKDKGYLLSMLQGGRL